MCILKLGADLGTLGEKICKSSACLKPSGLDMCVKGVLYHGRFTACPFEGEIAGTLFRSPIPTPALLSSSLDTLSVSSRIV